METKTEVWQVVSRPAGTTQPWAWASRELGSRESAFRVAQHLQGLGEETAVIHTVRAEIERKKRQHARKDFAMLGRRLH